MCTDLESNITDCVDLESNITDSVNLESNITDCVDLESNITDCVDLVSNITDSVDLETGMSQPELDVGETSERGSITADIQAQTPIDFSNKYLADPFYLQHKPITD